MLNSLISQSTNVSRDTKFIVEIKFLISKIIYLPVTFFDNIWMNKNSSSISFCSNSNPIYFELCLPSPKVFPLKKNQHIKSRTKK